MGCRWEMVVRGIFFWTHLRLKDLDEYFPAKSFIKQNLAISFSFFSKVS
jgi:hypothetical protein